MNKSLIGFLEPILAPEGFLLDEDSIYRKWSSDRTICCAVGLKRLDGGKFGTLEISFVAPQVLNWVCIPQIGRPLPYHGNGFGIYFRLEEMGIQEALVFPPGGWRISTAADRSFFKVMVSRELPARLKPHLVHLMTWDGWISFFREVAKKHPCGRGLAWSMLGYSMLMSSSRSIEEIQSAIDEHASQDASEKIGNRLDIHIARQRGILNERILANR